jgi:RNA 2',3'-cyclic 3'-phosphodiesterase
VKDTMPRLFIALDFPDDVLDALTELQQPEQPGVKWISRNQMHLTIHFLGETALEPVQAALATVAGSAFEMTLVGVGQFRAADGGTILWAGIQKNASLIELHATLTTALAPTGFRPETRPYSPHLTLARCRPTVPRGLLRDWLARHRDFRGASIPIRHLTLYSSDLRPDGPVYRAEHVLALHESTTR